MAREPVVPPRPPCALYLITPPAIPDLPAFARTLGEALDAGAVAALQIRLKDVDDAAVLAAVAALKPVAAARGVAVIPPMATQGVSTVSCQMVRISGSGRCVVSLVAVGKKAPKAT